MTTEPQDTGREGETARQVERAARGDFEELAGLYARVAPSMAAWARLRLGEALRSRIDADDVVQEVWCRALRGFHTYDARKSPFRAWLFSIAYRVLYDALHDVDRRHAAAPSSGPGGVDRLPAELSSITHRASRREWFVRFLEDASDLSEEERTLVLQRGLEGQPFDDVARSLGVSVEAAKKRWARLRARLARPEFSRDFLVT